MAGNPRSPADQESDRTCNPAASAEPVEGRGVAEGNLNQDITSRMQGRSDVPHALERVWQAATRDKELRFTALLHHAYSPETLGEAYFALKRDAAPGIDGVTWTGYGERLAENLQDLSERLKRGAYHAIPGRRAYIPKADGKLRPLGVIALEDKLVQRATTQVLNPEASDGKAVGSEGGAEAAHARARVPYGRVVENGGEGALRVLRGAHEPPGALSFPV